MPPAGPLTAALAAVKAAVTPHRGRHTRRTVTDRRTSRVYVQRLPAHTLSPGR